MSAGAGTPCERDGCGHLVGHHEASGPCRVEACECHGFKLLSRAERAERNTTRCSGCGKRVRPGGPHGCALWRGMPDPGVPCPRKGMGPDRLESWKP